MPEPSSCAATYGEPVHARDLAVDLAPDWSDEALWKVGVQMARLQSAESGPWRVAVDADACVADGLAVGRSANLEINWGEKQRWRATRPVAPRRCRPQFTVTCSVLPCSCDTFTASVSTRRCVSRSSRLSSATYIAPSPPASARLPAAQVTTISMGV